MATFWLDVLLSLLIACIAGPMLLLIVAFFQAGHVSQEFISGSFAVSFFVPFVCLLWTDFID